MTGEISSVNEPRRNAGRITKDQFVSCVPFPAMVSSICTARMHTRDLMEKWDLMVMVDDAELIVSEMMTNAIKATNAIPPEARYPELYDRLEVVCLCLYLLDEELEIDVWDPRPEPPTRREAMPDDEGGRGLLLVEALSRRWGIRWPSSGGKIVWARLGGERIGDGDGSASRIRPRDGRLPGGREAGA